MKSTCIFVSTVFGLFVAAGWALVSPAGAAANGPFIASSIPVSCSFPDPDPPVYYAIDMVGTRKVSGARTAKGIGNITFAASPYGVAISPEGTYVYDIDITMKNVRLAEGKALVAWVTTPDLDRIEPLGRLDENLHIEGQVSFNKYLVVITLEPDEMPGEKWTGPIVARGMSRSGLMHTMAGHGPFATEPCAALGFR